MEDDNNPYPIEGEDKSEEQKKPKYRQPPNKMIIVGIDLHIDNHTQKICENYNKTSSVTRSVLYVLLIVSIISIIAAFNSNEKFNWSQERISNNIQHLNFNEKLLASIRQKLEKNGGKKVLLVPDTMQLKDSIEYYTKREDSLISTDIENYNMVKVDFIGIDFDINDLSFIVGISIIILLIVLRFVLTRERNNLTMALNSITERYPDQSESPDFKKEISYLLKINKSKEIEDAKMHEKLLADINFTRRRFHYNFLSMNEVFNLPYLDTSYNQLQKKILGRIINRYFFYFALASYIYVVFNDFCTIHIGRSISLMHTSAVEIMSLACYFWIFNLCQSCVGQKGQIVDLFNDFFNKNYIYKHPDNAPVDSSVNEKIWNNILKPALLLIFVIGLSLIYDRTFELIGI